MGNEPSGLLIFGIMFAIVLGILGLMGIVGTLSDPDTRVQLLTAAGRAVRWMAATIGQLGESSPRSRRREWRPRPRPVRGAHGQFRGSVPIVPDRSEAWNEVPDRSENRTASERGGTTVPNGNDVPAVPPNVPEIVQITMLLTQGIAPGDVAKSLPGYSGRKYQEYMAKVREVQTALEATQKEGVGAQ